MRCSREAVNSVKETPRRFSSSRVQSCICRLLTSPERSDFGHLEGRLWRTLGTLFFLPGKLPQDYLANKRARYVKPLKLYLAAIALAFAAVQFLGWDLDLKFGGPGFHLSFDLLR